MDEIQVNLLETHLSTDKHLVTPRDKIGNFRSDLAQAVFHGLPDRHPSAELRCDVHVATLQTFLPDGLPNILLGLIIFAQLSLP